MHEVALAQSLVALIEQSQQQQGFTRVIAMDLVIGAWSCVDPDALRQGIHIATRRTVAADAEIRLTRVPARAFCMSCSTTVTLAQRGDPCPHCGSHQLIVESGEELRLTSIEVL